MGLVAGALRRAVDVAVAHQVGQAPLYIRKLVPGVEDVDVAPVGGP